MKINIFPHFRVEHPACGFPGTVNAIQSFEPSKPYELQCSLFVDLVFKIKRLVSLVAFDFDFTETCVVKNILTLIAM